MESDFLESLLGIAGLVLVIGLFFYLKGRGMAFP